MHLRILSTIALSVENEIKLERHRREEFLDGDENLQDRVGGLQRLFSPAKMLLAACCKGAACGGLFKVFGPLAKSFFEWRCATDWQNVCTSYSYHASQQKTELLRHCLCFLRQEQMKTELADVRFLPAMDGFGSQVDEPKVKSGVRKLRGIERSKRSKSFLFLFSLPFWTFAPFCFIVRICFIVDILHDSCNEIESNFFFLPLFEFL